MRLEGLPEGAEEALGLVDGFDDVLVHGFARIGEERAAALAALAGALAATPLGDGVREAVEKVTAGSITEEHLTVLAGARTALLGAVHDALLAQLDEVTGRTRAGWTGTQDTVRPERSWLTELAITGWRGVSHDLVSAADHTIEALLADPATRGQAVLLDGLAAELRACSPVATMEEVPARRWADLWARAMLAAGAAQPAREVSGRLLILGVDVHEHGTAVQLQVHGVLEGPELQLVRTSVSVGKVDTITGRTTWPLFAAYPVLLAAVEKHRSVDVRDLTLLESGDLLWSEERATLGEPVDPFVTARLHLGQAIAPAVPPLDRHPVRIAEPVLIEGKHTLEVAETSTSGPPMVKAATACIGLLRWDGRWVLQPLATQGKKSAHTGEWALDSQIVKAGNSVTILKERAGRLLRK